MGFIRGDRGAQQRGIRGIGLVGAQRGHRPASQREDPEQADVGAEVADA
jgi:hypothetical protein